MKPFKLLVFDDDGLFLPAFTRAVASRGMAVESELIPNITSATALREIIRSSVSKHLPDAVAIDIGLVSNSDFDESGLALAAAIGDVYKFWLTSRAVSPLPEIFNSNPSSSPMPIVRKVISEHPADDTADAVILHLVSSGLAQASGSLFVKLRQSD